MAKLKQNELLKQKLNFMTQSKDFLIKQMGEDEYASELRYLHETLDKSKRGKSAKVKGSSYENNVAKKFKQAFGFELTRTPLSGGFAKHSKRGDDFKGDIVCLNDDVDFILHVECKNQKTWSLKSWLKQAKEDCSANKIPAVIFHQNRETSEGKVSQTNDDYITLRLEDFFALVKPEKLFRRVK